MKICFKNILLLVILFLTNQIAFSQQPVSPLPPGPLTSYEALYTGSCDDSELTEANYTNIPEYSFCDDTTKVRYIPIAIHFILPESKLDLQYEIGGIQYTSYDNEGNFTESQDGTGNYSYNGFQRAEDIVNDMNLDFEEAQEIWRKVAGFSYDPNGEDPNIRFLLSGVYFIRDNNIYRKTNTPSARSILRTNHDIDGNNVIDVYMDTRQDNSGFVLSLGSTDKFMFVNNYPIYVHWPNSYFPTNNASSTINHEIGHLLNLWHTWRSDDGCNDTKKGFPYQKVVPSGTCPEDRANCYAYDPSIPGCMAKPCDDWSKISNNFMDHSGYARNGMTKCQIGRMNKNLKTFGNSYIHSCNGCMPSQAFFNMPDTINSCGLLKYVTMNGQASFNEDEYLIEICPVNNNGSSSCLSGYYSSGWISGTVYEENLVNLYSNTFQNNTWYKITLTVNNSNCPDTDSYTDFVFINDCNVNDPGGPFDEFEINSVTNPFPNSLTVDYDMKKTADIDFWLYNPQSNSTIILEQQTNQSTGNYSFTETYSISGLTTGAYYFIVSSSGGDFHSQVLIR